MAEFFEMRDGSTTRSPKLGRLKDFDERSRSFAVAEVVPADYATTIWTPKPAMNQGEDGTCVGHGFEAEAGAKPVATRANHSHAIKWFDLAARIDPFPGVSRRNGTTVLAGAKIGVRTGYFKSYRWAFTLNEVKAALTHNGPVVVGTDWLSGMWAPTWDGRLPVEGNSDGRHCWLIYGLVLEGVINPFTGLPAETDIFLMQNSWGTGWGRNGRAWMPDKAFDFLRVNDGEVCVPMDRMDPYAPRPLAPVVKHRWTWDRFRGWVSTLFS